MFSQRKYDELLAFILIFKIRNVDCVITKCGKSFFAIAGKNYGADVAHICCSLLNLHHCLILFVVLIYCFSI
jgi:hypothetical protein